MGTMVGLDGGAGWGWWILRLDGVVDGGVGGTVNGAVNGECVVGAWWRWWGLVQLGG